MSKHPLVLKRWEEQNRQTIAEFRSFESEVDFSEIWNCHYAAYILIHSSSVADLSDAHEYAKKAVEMGSKVTRWLYAATLDRYLVAQGKKQKFGTQFEQIDGAWRLLPYDSSTTDKERKEYGVPPIHEALNVFHQKYSHADS